MGGLQTIETLKATGGEADLFARWAGYQAKVVNGQQELERYTQILDAVPPLLSAVNTALILGLGGLRVMDGALTLGGAGRLPAPDGRFIAPVNRLVSLGGRLQDGRGRHEPARRRAALPRGSGGRRPLWRARSAGGGAGQAGRPPGAARRLLRLQPARSAADRRLQPDARSPAPAVALVGGSGSGKSTLAKLVTGLYQPWSGRDPVRRPAARRDPAARADQLAGRRSTRTSSCSRARCARTSPSGTRRPAARGRGRGQGRLHPRRHRGARRAATTARSRRAAPTGAAASASAWRSRARWSAGPSLLVLDEATSALDPTTESRIDENLRRRGCTCLIVAHRLSTIRDADEIIVLEQGKVVQRGTHDELKGVEGPYARLISTE